MKSPILGTPGVVVFQSPFLLAAILCCVCSLAFPSAAHAQPAPGEPWSVREPGRFAQPAPRTNEPIQGASFSTERPLTGRPLDTGTPLSARSSATPESATQSENAVGGAIGNTPATDWQQPGQLLPGSARPLPTRQRSSSGGSTSGRTTGTPLWLSVFGLIVVLGGAATGLLWLRRHGPTAWRPLPNEAVELLGRRTLEPRVSVHLIRCGHRMLLVGVGPDGARTLSEIHDPVEVDLLAGLCRRPADNGGDFLQSLQRFMPSRSHEPPSAPAGTANAATGKHSSRGSSLTSTFPSENYPMEGFPKETFHRREGQRG